MAWLILVAAGLLEIAWAVGLKASEGLTRPVPAALTIAAMIASMVLLGLSLRTLPLGTAYTVWTGIGAIGTVVFGIVMFGESATPARLIAIALIVAGIVALRLTEGR
ncbi:MAG TPA: quaternary ammonium compound efflux SMR transporter SugE [Gammaproteobacteria bacterium]|nr:quaternary ammonium compound efflux SMR transporter SugE [Gammaproteobacteria bacterium]